MRATVWIFGLTAMAATGALVYWAPSQNEPKPATHVAEQRVDTIAAQWQWGNFAKNDDAAIASAESPAANKPRVQSEMPYDAVGVYKVLQSIRLDENGRVVPDLTAMQALERGYSELGPDLSPEAMAELQALIRVGLPGPAGEEAARILENYYRFRAAETEFNQLRIAREKSNGSMGKQLPTVDSYEELVALRRSYLGKDVADGLFAAEDAQARHMLAVLAVEQDAALTAEQKQAQQAALQAQLNERLVAIGQLTPEEAAAERVRQLRESGASNADIHATREAMLGAQDAYALAAADRENAQWQQRFNGFWQARRYVMQAGLDEAERERQIEQLLEQYFSPEERDRARATSFDWQARESQ